MLSSFATPWRNMSPAMREARRPAIMSGRFHHDGNPVMSWMAADVVAGSDAKDNIFLAKGCLTIKIDRIVALLMAVVARCSASRPSRDINPDYHRGPRWTRRIRC